MSIQIVEEVVVTPEVVAEEVVVTPEAPVEEEVVAPVEEPVVTE